ncbi:hypothetical protein [Vibrio harveyi]|uniref:hypothetical protein n=1 Tax=Vibrio harveyi TaxID=669 RepID=UPI0037364915
MDTRVNKEVIKPLASPSLKSGITTCKTIPRSHVSPVDNKLLGSNQLKALLDELQSPFDISKDYSLSPYVHWKENSISSIHRWLRYREAYSPELIDKLGLTGKILDPFSGCGSIMVGAAQRGLISTGVDINPLSTFSTKVKLTKLTSKELNEVERFKNSLESIVNESPMHALPELSIAEKVFEPEILEIILKTKSAIKNTQSKNKKVGDFLHLAWLESLEKVGSYYKEGNGIKYRNKQRRKGKYIEKIDGEWQLKRFGPDQKSFAIDTIKKQIDIMLSDTNEWSSGLWSQQRVINGSALELETLIPEKVQFDSIIFSPPYANRFDYFEAFKVELWFGGFVESYNDLNKLRKKSIRSHLAAEYRTNNPIFEELESLITMMDKNTSSWRMGVPDLLRGYFQDMHTVLAQCRKLAPKGRTHVVVGNSAFAGVIIPTDILTAMIGLKSGFNKVKIIESRHLTVSPQQRAILKGFEDYMRESVVIFE